MQKGDAFTAFNYNIYTPGGKRRVFESFNVVMRKIKAIYFCFRI